MIADLDPSPYGVNSHVDAEVIDRLTGCGIRWHRVDFDWDEIARAEGELDWSVPDALVSKADECGASLLACIAYTPRWASRAEAQAGLEPRLARALPPREAQDYVEFVRRVVERTLAGRPHCVSLWNEPNDARQFWRGTVEQYVETMSAALEAVREVAPDLTIAGPDLATWPGNGTERFLAALVESGIPSRYYDVIAHHQYGGDRAETAQSRIARVDAFHDALCRHGLGDRPVWVTEIGWAVPEFDERTRAERLRQTIEGMQERRDWWQKTFWYDSHGERSGLVSVAGEASGAGEGPAAWPARPALDTYARLIQEAGGTVPTRWTTAEARVRLLYAAVLGRTAAEIDADAGGLAHHTRRAQRASTREVCRAFLDSAEYEKRWAGATHAAIAAHVLGTIRQRDADRESAAALAAELAEGRGAERIALLIETRLTERRGA